MKSFTAKLAMKDVKAQILQVSTGTPKQQSWDRLEKAGIILKVKYSQWAAPVVAVPKSLWKLLSCLECALRCRPVPTSLIYSPH